MFMYPYTLRKKFLICPSTSRRTLNCSGSFFRYLAEPFLISVWPKQGYPKSFYIFKNPFEISLRNLSKIVLEKNHFENLGSTVAKTFCKAAEESRFVPFKNH
jgi:hypothetical protein